MNRHARLLIAAMVGLGVLVVAQPAQAICCPMTVAQVRAAVVGMHIGPSKATDGGRATITDTYWQDNKVWAHWDVTYPPGGVQPPSGASTLDNLVVSYDAPLAGGHHHGGMKPDSWWDPTSWDWGSIFGSIWDAWNRCYTGAVSTLTALVGSGLVVKGWVSGMSFLKKMTGTNMSQIMIGACIASVIG